MSDENKVIFGLEKVHVAFRNPDGSYENPILIPGAVNLGLNAEGDSSTLYADDIPYFTMTSNNGYTGDLEFALLPIEVLAEMLGWRIDTNGLLIESSDAMQKEFALLYQVIGNAKNKRYVFYDCKAGRPAENHASKSDKNEAQTQSLPLTVLPVEVNGSNIVKGVIELNDTNEAIYNDFYSKVLLPDATATEVVKTTLAATIALAQKLDEADYTPESWTTFNGVLTSATTVNSNAEATQYDVNNANKALQDAMLKLVAAA